jgi:hypothetical protein
VTGEYSRLGTATETVIGYVEEQRRWFGRKSVEREIEYLEWTIDGVPLREVVAWPNGWIADDVTPINNANADRAYEADYVRAILGEPVLRDWTLMPDGRVPLLVCPLDFDLDCGALTAQLRRDHGRVVWGDIAWQHADHPLDLPGQEISVISLEFDAAQYDGIVRPLLDAALRS